MFRDENLQFYGRAGKSALLIWSSCDLRVMRTSFDLKVTIFIYESIHIRRSHNDVVGTMSLFWTASPTHFWIGHLITACADSRLKCQDVGNVAKWNGKNKKLKFSENREILTHQMSFWEISRCQIQKSLTLIYRYNDTSSFSLSLCVFDGKGSEPNSFLA